MAASEPSMKDLREDIETLRQDLAALRDDAAGFAHNAARHGRRVVRDHAESAMGSARHMADQAESIYDDGADYVRRNPTISVLVAFGVGALAAKLLGGNQR